ncbi:signal peptidase I [Aeromicrobium sp. Leaf350]|uniref:signal peptidase I n=1 Tax=Aeromicrobium sp. Leaf350 TaxID=2876565 RepID=UPI001E548F50|nr:signal peptidase I [Aeromicrobium sp. Leaf350]
MDTPMTKTRSAFGFLTLTLTWTVILATTAMVAVGVLVPRAGGATPYTVLTGSMRPDFPPGTLVVVKPVDADDIKVGDVVTYQLVSGEPEVVTHRVVGIGAPTNGSDERTFITQGDANSIVDAKPVIADQVRGRLWYSVPLLGHVNHALSGSARQVVTTGVVIALLAYAAWAFGSSLLDRRTNRTAATTSTKKKGAHAA